MWIGTLRLSVRRARYTLYSATLASCRRDTSWQFTREADYLGTCIANNQTSKTLWRRGLPGHKVHAQIYRATGVPLLTS